MGIFADTAQKAGQHNDFTVFILAGTDGRNVYILDLLRDRLEAPDLISAAKAFYERHRPNRITNPVRFAGFFVEDKVSGTGLIQTLRRETDIPVIPIQRDRDKVSVSMTFSRTSGQGVFSCRKYTVGERLHRGAGGVQPGHDS